MDQQTKVFRVFIASPGDLADERRALRDVVERLDTICSKGDRLASGIARFVRAEAERTARLIRPCCREGSSQRTVGAESLGSGRGRDGQRRGHAMVSTGAAPRT